MSNYNKVLSVLKKYSDRDHPLTAEKINDYLEADNGITLNRKTIRKQIDEIIDDGIYDIEATKKGYFISERTVPQSDIITILSKVGKEPLSKEEASKLIDSITQDYSDEDREKINNVLASIPDDNTPSNREILDRLLESKDDKGLINATFKNGRKYTFYPAVFYWTDENDKRNLMVACIYNTGESFIVKHEYIDDIVSCERNIPNDKYGRTVDVYFRKYQELKSVKPQLLIPHGAASLGFIAAPKNLLQDNDFIFSKDDLFGFSYSSDGIYRKDLKKAIACLPSLEEDEKGDSNLWTLDNVIEAGSKEVGALIDDISKMADRTSDHSWRIQPILVVISYLLFAKRKEILSLDDEKVSKILNALSKFSPLKSIALDWANSLYGLDA